ncbi:MAG TPA: transposase, partial [Candidatus Mediterraneibacter merdavium]|nr:transposase [Candidatus Mediterraneibacter merdavium]
LKLSDLYTFREKDKEDGKTGKADFKLELKAELLNICGDNNKALKEACRTLREYAVFTDKMRKYTKTMDIQAAAERTIEECIQEDILREFLTKHRAEVRTMSIFEYDQEKHMRQEREQAWEEGREAGLAEGEAKGKAAGIAEGKAAGFTEGERNKLSEQIQKKLRKGKTVAQIADELEESPEVIKELLEKIEK